MIYNKNITILILGLKTIKVNPNVKSSYLLSKLFNLWGLVIRGDKLIANLYENEFIEGVKGEMSLGKYQLSQRGLDFEGEIDIVELLTLMKNDYDIREGDVLNFFKEYQLL